MRRRGTAVRAAVAIAGMAAAALTGPGSARAQESPAAHGDARRGKALANTCLGCHGIEGYKNAYPMYSVPRLEGQSPDYLPPPLPGSPPVAPPPPPLPPHAPPPPH